MASNLQEAKFAIRQQIKIVLSRMNIEDKFLQSNYVTDKVLQHREYLTADRIGIYLSLPDEIQTDTILKHMFSVGKSSFIPRFNSDTMDMVRMFTYEEHNTLPKTKWNIPQPSQISQREDAIETGGLDLLIVPARALTKSGHRLGRGKGYYDKFLAQYKEKFQQQLPFTIGVVFSHQIYDTLPVEESDVKLDEVLYDDRELYKSKYKYE